MVNHLIHKLKHLIFTLRFSILSIFISLFIFTTVLIIIITSIRFTHTLSTAASQLMGYASTSVLRELTAGIRPAAIETQFAAHLIENDLLNVQQISGPNDPDLMPFTYYLIKNMPFAMSAYWGDKYGDFIYTQKTKDGTITTNIYKRQHTPATRTTIYRDKLGQIIKRVPSSNLVYDPRVRPWYIEAKAEKKTIWTDIYFFRFFQQGNQGITTGITTASPVFNKGQFYGVFGIDIDLEYLSQFTTNQVITPNGFSFIITKDGKLVAYPKRKPFTNLNVPAGQFINVNSVELPIIKGSFEQYKKSGKKKLTFYYNDLLF